MVIPRIRLKCYFDIRKLWVGVDWHKHVQHRYDLHTYHTLNLWMNVLPALVVWAQLEWRKPSASNP